MRNRIFGYYSVEFEKYGKDRAFYENGLRSSLARVMLFVANNRLALPHNNELESIIRKALNRIRPWW